MRSDFIAGLVNLVILMIVLVLIIRCLDSPKETFNNTPVNNYLVNVAEEHMEFILSNVKLGQFKYLTVIQHRAFNANNRMYYPIGQLSIITEEIIPQQ